MLLLMPAAAFLISASLTSLTWLAVLTGCQSLPMDAAQESARTEAWLRPGVSSSGGVQQHQRRDALITTLPDGRCARAYRTHWAAAAP